MDLSVILPIYNEVENIEPLLAEIEEALIPSGKSFEVIAVDDASNDGSRELLKKIQPYKSYLKVILFRRNAGQASAFDAGFRAASGKVVVTMDADRQNDPKDILPMVAKLDEGFDFVSGWRKKRKDGLWLRKVPSRIANYIIRKVTGTRLHDMGCSLKVYRKEISDEMRLYGEMHRFIAVLAQNLGARCGEHVVNHRPRVAGQSKYGLARTVKVVLDLFTVWFMRSYQTKPIYIFGGMGMTVLAASAALAAFVLYEKFMLGVWVHKNPLFLLSIMLGVMAGQCLGLGILAEMMIRTYFESERVKQPYQIGTTFGFDNLPLRKRA